MPREFRLRLQMSFGIVWVTISLLFAYLLNYILTQPLPIPTLTDYFFLAAFVGELVVFGISSVTYRRMGLQIAMIKLRHEKGRRYNSPVFRDHPQYLRLFKNLIKWFRDRIKTMSKLWFAVLAEILIGLILGFMKGEISLPPLAFFFLVLINLELLAFVSDTYNTLSSLVEEKLEVYGFEI